MENSSDKQIRGKLSSTEFPFDPQAWEQMEAMLDEKKKRGMFFWWWTGGIAAALLFGVIGYELRGVVGSEENKGAAVNSGSKQTNTNTIAALGSSSKQLNTNTVSTIEKNQQSNTNNREEKAEVSTSTVASSKLKNEKRNSSPALIRANHTNPRHPRSIVFSDKQSKNASSTETATQISATGNQRKEEIEMLNAAAFRNNSTAENILLARREAELLQTISDKTETGFDKKEEDVVPKKKGKVFHYSVGCIAGVSFVTVGKQKWNTNRIFFPSPTYIVGLTNDFLFAERAAITTGVVFSQTSFIISKPQTSLPDNRMTYYTSKITELDIPIGIKIYAVVKNNFRFYINAGIINHIKLKETFDYAFDADTSTSFVASIADNSTFPSQTNFAPEAASINRTASGNPSSTKDFSINNAKRYYTSFYASAGFEFIAKKHFVLFAEPAFFMGLQKIGVQEKRKYNLGLSGGFRYQF